MENFKKVVRIGTAKTYGGAAYSIFCKIEFKDGELSITGVEGPRPNGDAVGGAGQIVMHLIEPDGLKTFTPAPGWTLETVKQFLNLWDRWHLNKLKAGSPAQEKHLRALKYDRSKDGDHYDWARRVLTEAGLQPDPGHVIPLAHIAKGEPQPYSYGSAWLREDVPEDVLVWLKSLPDTDRKPAWV